MNIIEISILSACVGFIISCICHILFNYWTSREKKSSEELREPSKEWKSMMMRVRENQKRRYK